MDTLNFWGRGTWLKNHYQLYPLSEEVTPRLLSSLCRSHIVSKPLVQTQNYTWCCLKYPPLLGNRMDQCLYWYTNQKGKKSGRSSLAPTRTVAVSRWLGNGTREGSATSLCREFAEFLHIIRKLNLLHKKSKINTYYTLTFLFLFNQQHTKTQTSENCVYSASPLRNEVLAQFFEQNELSFHT